ncbi:MAG: hypothetical protein ACOX7C_09385 [Brevefilum sp.]
MQQMDQHFYIDYCPYDQAINTLKALNSDSYISSSELTNIIGDEYRSEVRRRLIILNLAEEKNEGRSSSYILTGLGKSLKEICYFDEELLPDLFHFLHMMYYSDDAKSPKMLWSYASCSKLFWNYGELLPNKELASIIQNKIKSEFPSLDYSAPKGGRFDHYAAGRWVNYVKNLTPSPVDENKKLKKE